MQSITAYTITIVTVAWAIFIVVWIVSAFSAKRTAKRAGGPWLAYRLGMVVVLIILLRYTGLSHTIIYPLFYSALIRIVGTVLVLLGLALCIWARYHLGRNWGMPVSEKVGAELVTSGPYAYIRNPIYAGMLMAMIGSALALSAIWAVILIAYGGYFFWSVFGEEKIMARLFPDTYPAYKARTWRLIPRVW